MKKPRMKTALWVLLAWVFTGTAVMAVPAAPATERDLCKEATASVTIDEVTAGEDTVDAKGTWQAGGGAIGVLLEYRVNSDRLRAETWTGASGSWTISRFDPEEGRCGRRTLRLQVFPSIQDGTRQLHCLRKPATTTRHFEISCAPVAEILNCEWECSRDETPQCTGLCTASARRGRLIYLPFWGVNGDGWQKVAEGASKGPWTFPVACDPGQRISFKVQERDESGSWSKVDELGCGATE
ncbi:MAG TPA: hypothetical protein VN493_20450 [Thermoanaerobaculia bacterium]|nr:hypothetical protein [Thermoanaerobaculia bacterium]